MSVNASSGDSGIILSCMADSFPDPEYRWERSSTNEGPYTEIAEGSTYDLGNISYSANGFYRCIAYTNVSGIINEIASNPAIVSGKINYFHNIDYYKYFPFYFNCYFLTIICTLFLFYSVSESFR